MTLLDPAQREIRELKAQLCAVLSLSNDVQNAESDAELTDAVNALQGSIQASSALIRTYACDLVVEDE